MMYGQINNLNIYNNTSWFTEKKKLISEELTKYFTLDITVEHNNYNI